MQVSGGSQSFNAVNQMRILGRWMRMLTIPNQSSIPKAFQEFDEAGRMRPSPRYDRIVDVTEELVKFTLLTRDRANHFVIGIRNAGNGGRADRAGEPVLRHLTARAVRMGPLRHSCLAGLKRYADRGKGSR
jgi:hypothetical protein